MQDRPDAPELLGALTLYLFEDLLPHVSREQRFNVRVAANCCAILARELEAGEDAVAEEAMRLLGLQGLEERDMWLVETEAGHRHLGDRDELSALQAEIAAAIRAGALDDRWDETVETLRESVAAKLATAHPGYEDFADDGH